MFRKVNNNWGRLDYREIEHDQVEDLCEWEESIANVLKTA